MCIEKRVTIGGHHRPQLSQLLVSIVSKIHFWLKLLSYTILIISKTYILQDILDLVTLIQKLNTYPKIRLISIL